MRNVAIGVGVGAAVGLAIVALAPPRVSIPREKYIVDYGRANEDDLYGAFDAPPVDRLERAYSLEEIRDNFELRQRMRYVELNNINFKFREPGRSLPTSIQSSSGWRGQSTGFSDATPMRFS